MEIKNTMKNILLIGIIAIGINVKAQITLEHTYDTASTFSTIGPNGAEQCQMMIVKFEVSGERYCQN